MINDIKLLEIFRVQNLLNEKKEDFNHYVNSCRLFVFTYDPNGRFIQYPLVLWQVRRYKLAKNIWQ